MYFCTGAQDYKCPLQSDLLSDAKDLYGHSGNLLVDETFKDFTDSIFREFELHYPPFSHQDALYLYFIITDECKNFSS